MKYYLWIQEIPTLKICFRQLVRNKKYYIIFGVVIPPHDDELSNICIYRFNYIRACTRTVNNYLCCVTINAKHSSTTVFETKTYVTTPNSLFPLIQRFAV